MIENYKKLPCLYDILLSGYRYFEFLKSHRHTLVLLNFIHTKISFSTKTILEIGNILLKINVKGKH